MTNKKMKPLGKLSPWVWSVEFVRGCNLRCWHCTAQINPPDYNPLFMSRETWIAMCYILKNVTPYTRLELAQGGEPTLHPNLLEFLRIAKKITPTTQIQVTTNGITLLNGKVKLQHLFTAGAHSVYIDMYAPTDNFIKLAKEINAEWYLYNEPKVASIQNHHYANIYYGDKNMRLVILQDNPEYRLKWRHEGRLSTFLNHLNWEKCLPYGLIPVRESYRRKCTLPMRYSSLSVDGDYLFCCIDFWCESAGLLGNVSDGAMGFKKYWFGKLIQSIRRHLINGDRGKIPYCSRCNCAFSKCDWVRMWPDKIYELYLENGQMKSLPPVNEDDEIFVSGWKWYDITNKNLPSIEQEKRILSSSDKRIIFSDSAVKKSKCKNNA